MVDVKDTVLGVTVDTLVAKYQLMLQKLERGSDRIVSYCNEQCETLLDILSRSTQSMSVEEKKYLLERLREGFHFGPTHNVHTTAWGLIRFLEAA